MDDIIETKWGSAKIVGGYYVITTRKEGNHGKALHRLVFEDFYNIELPPDIDIHHHDGDKLNNNIWNLIPLTRSEHIAIHQNERIEQGNYVKNPSIESRLKSSKSQGSSGYFRVHTHKEPTCKQGFYYQYRWIVDGKEKSISRVDINKLKEEVLKRGLEWFEYDT